MYKMARPKGTKNIMRTPEEKAKIIEEYLNGKEGLRYYVREYGINYSVLHKWYEKYLKDGIEGLKSKTGKDRSKNKGRHQKPKNREEELELKIMKLEIENARLKKGYLVRGGGDQKEYVTTLDENTK